MAIVKVKPTSPGRRAMVKVVNKDLHKGKPFAALLDAQSVTAGRNNSGRITTRHKGGGHKQHYRMVDFRRNKDGIPAKIERLEYDPNRSANIALLLYADGERTYIIAPKGATVGQALMSGSEAPIRSGNTLPIRNIPVGTTIHCIEMLPGKGAQMARSAGTSAMLLAREGTYAQVRLRSGEIRRVPLRQAFRSPWQTRPTFPATCPPRSSAATHMVFPRPPSTPSLMPLFSQSYLTCSALDTSRTRTVTG